MTMIKVSLAALLCCIQLGCVASFAGCVLREASPIKLGATNLGLTASSPLPPSQNGEESSYKHKNNAMKHFLQYLNQQEERLVTKLGATRHRVAAYQASLRAVRAERRQVQSQQQQQQSTTMTIGSEESTRRRVVNAMAWRVLAGLVTFFTTRWFTASQTAAWHVTITDFLSKSLIAVLLIGKMNASSTDRRNHGVNHVHHSASKAVIGQACWVMANTWLVALYVTHDVRVALTIASVNAVWQSVLMVPYNRITARIPWGKVYYALPDKASAVREEETEVIQTRQESSSLLGRASLYQTFGSVQARLDKLIWVLFPKQPRPGLVLYGANATALDVTGGMAM